MKKIIFSNKISRIKKLLAAKCPVVYYPIFQVDKEHRELLRLLKTKNNFKSALNLNIKKNISENFQKKFVDFIAGLNEKNCSFLWFGLNFVNKNPLTTKFCYRVYHILSILNLVNNSEFDTFLIVTGDMELYRQMRIIFKSGVVKVKCAISQKVDASVFLKHIAPLAVFFAFFRIVLFKSYARLFCRPRIERNRDTTIVFSLLNEHSFAKDGSYRDAFFGNFVFYLREKNVNFLNILCVITSSYKQIVKKAVKNASGVNLATIEYFLKFSDLLFCLWQALVKYFSSIRLEGVTSISDIDITHLVKNAIRNDYRSSYFFDNLRIYYAVKRIASCVSIDSLFYPFENMAFEKMIILALRRFSPGTRIVGYQHSSISQRHTNFLLGESEHKIIPLPDIILTMGEVTKNIMHSTGCFPLNLLETGCALRQQPFRGRIKPRKNKITHIFVVLSSDLEEYVKVLNFLEKVFEKKPEYEIWLRPHPVFSLEEAIKINGLSNFKFYNANRETLSECYQWADILLYVHSTLSIEALMWGIPVVNLDIAEVLDPDPLFNFYDFRWRVGNPQDLLPIIYSIEAMSDSDFVLRQEKAQDYAKRYLFEPNEERLERFYSITRQDEKFVCSGLGKQEVNEA